MKAVLLSLLLAVVLSLSRAEDVVWYIGKNGSSDLSTCGRSIATPCINLTVILQGSQLFGNTTVGLCRMSNGDIDGRTSTTVNFLEGRHFVDPVCMRNWHNLRLVGLAPKGSVFMSTANGGLNGLFEFSNSMGISFSNLVFDTNYIGRSLLYFGDCRDITIADSTFTMEIAHTRGVEMVRCSGTISVTGSTFRGNPELAALPNNFVVGLSVIHGCDSANTCGSVSPGQPFQLSVSDTLFTDVSSGGPVSDSYASTRSRGTALRLQFLYGSMGNRAIFNNITVTRAASLGGSSAVVNFDTGSDGNIVLFTRSKFIDNCVRFGGGVAGYFYSSPRNNFLDIEDCVFEENKVAFEGGGVFAVFLQSDETNSLRITRSTFTRNSAIVGAGVFLLSNPFWFSQRGVFDPVSPALVTSNLTDCTFVENRADHKEGVVNALRLRLHLEGVSVFANNTGSALYLRLSIAYFSGEMSFYGNMADTGGAMSIRDGSRVDLSGVSKGLFAHNKAAFAGGAIYADAASTSKLAVEYNHTQAQGVFGTCFMMFGNEPVGSSSPQAPRRFTFVGNLAVAEGQSIHSFSLRGCIVANFVPEQTAEYLLIPSDGTVVYEDPSILDNTATGASNLFFFGSSTKCYKTVANTTYLLPNCSHDLISNTFSSHPGLHCGLDRLFNNDFQLIPGTGLRPPIDKLYTPWASIGSSWTSTPGNSRRTCPEPDPGNFVLSPAPGEEFDITIQLADQLLNYVSSTIYIDVLHEAETPPGALLQLNGIQFAYNDRVYFTPNRALSGLAIVGLPGTRGKLRVVADSQVMGQTIQLLIPFQLSQCPLGYFNPPGASTLDEVNQLILTEFRLTQRIPLNQPLSCQCFVNRNGTFTPVPGTNTAPSTCIQGYTVLVSSIYWAGHIPMETGPSPLPEEPCLTVLDAEPVDDDGFTVWVRQSRQNDSANGISAGFDPVDVVPGENGVIPGGGAPVTCYRTRNVSELVEYRPLGEFTIDVCTRGYCRGDAQSAWFLSDVGFPCIENREGVLCGQCKEGFAVTVYTTTCYDCRGKVYQGVIALLLTSFGGVVLVLLAIAFKLGLSPTIDSMLFFIQGVLIVLSGRTDYAIFTYYLPFFNPDFTLNLCITPELTAFGRLLLQFITPFYMLLLLGVVLVLGRYTRLSRLLGKHSFLQGLWLLFILSYFNISNSAFELLHCRVTTSAQGNFTRYLLTHDASVECFSGSHLPAAILSNVILVTIVVPMPLYVYIAMCFPRLKPITDVYCSAYRDRRRWWVSLSLLRRLVLVVLGVYIQDYVWRHLVLFFALGIIQIIYVLTWPYKTRVDNYFGFMIGWTLLLMGLITQPALYLSIDPSRIVSMVIVVLTILASICVIVLETALRFRDLSIGKFATNMYHKFKACLKGLKSNKYSLNIQELEESTQSTMSTIIPKQGTVDATAYREPLLDSTFTSPDGSINVNSSSAKLRDSFEKGKRWGVNRRYPSSRATKSMEAMPGGVGDQSRTSVTLVTPEDESGYLDAGIAATLYIEAPQ